VILWTAAAPAVLAQQEEPAAAPAEPEGPSAYPLGEVTIQAEQTRTEIAEMSQQLAPLKAIQDLDDQIAPAQEKIEAAVAETKRILSEDPISTKALEDGEREWTGRDNELRTWRGQVTGRAAEVDEKIARLGVLGERWKLTRKAATETDAATSMEWIDGALEQVSEAEDEARRRSKALVELQSRVTDLQTTITDNLALIRNEASQQRSRLLEPDSPPIWQGWRPVGDVAGVRERLSADWQRDLASLGKFAKDRATGLVQFGLVLLAIFLGTVMLGRRLSSWIEDDEELRRAAEVFHRPVSVALLASLLASPYFFPLAPGIFTDLLGALLLIPAIRLLAPLVKPAMRPIVYGLAIFYTSSQVRVMLDATPVASRLLFTLELFVAIGAFVWVLRPSRLLHVEADDRPPAIIGKAIQLLLVLMVVAFAANLLGYFGFAKLMARGILITIYAALIARGTFQIAMIFVTVLMRTPVARRLRMVRMGGDSIRLWIGRVAGLVLTFMWVDAVIEAFTIRSSTLEFLDGLTQAEIPLGALQISAGDVLTFVFVIAASFYLSRFVRFVLAEDVFPRVVMRRGVPNAISTTITYAILLFGFILALGAAGVELSRLTLLAGAFGVGIGFGLQDIVNNFVSGLILLFERPIQVGDTIEMQGEGLLGEVRHIGPRSSQVRTFDGAEVIVPNGMLISNQVINWTLSDRRRRLTVDIGVKYGTEPERVLAILEEVAAENTTVLEEPEPLSIFLGFGDSSLDFQLRCWIPRYEEGFGIRTALRVAICAKLNAAGIEIPFPQRDLHLRSVDGEAARTLRGD
jgi:small-conductance mechanosensitive channel